jgi:hypothetical protein
VEKHFSTGFSTEFCGKLWKTFEQWSVIGGQWSGKRDGASFQTTNE